MITWLALQDPVLHEIIQILSKHGLITCGIKNLKSNDRESENRIVLTRAKDEEETGVEGQRLNI